MQAAGATVVLALCFCLGCSRPPFHKPVTVTFLDLEWDAQDRLPGLGKDLVDFTRESGIQVKRLPGPDGSLSQLGLWKELLQKGAGSPDLCNIDVVWSGILGQYLMDLKPYFDTSLYLQDPVLVSSYTVGNQLVAIPHHAYVGVLFYRSDLLRRYGYPEPPETWDELERMAARIQAGERAKGDKEFWGFVWDGFAGEDLTCAGLEWQISEGGGRIIEDDKTISVNNPQAIRSWQRAARWVGSISPPGVVAYGKWDAENFWGSGKAAFYRGWVSDYSLRVLHTPPAGATEFGVTSVPGGPAGQASTLGGNGLSVPRTSAHPREAMELIRYLRRQDIQFGRDRDRSPQPKELVLFALPSILQAYPQPAKPGLVRGNVVARPSVAAGPKYEEVSRAYIRAVHAVLTGDQAPAAAAAALEKELVGLTGFSLRTSR